MSSIVLVSSSLNPQSRSAILIHQAAKVLQSQGWDSEVIDLREVLLPFCDGRKLEEYPQDLIPLQKKLLAAKGLVFGVPVYCYSLSGGLKNFIDLFSRSCAEKPFGVCAAAGSPWSYLAIADLFRIMNFESKAIGIQPTVMATPQDFTEDQISNPELEARLETMVQALTEKLG